MHGAGIRRDQQIELADEVGKFFQAEAPGQIRAGNARQAGRCLGQTAVTRAVAQNVAYEIPLLLAVLSVAFMTGSLNLATISGGQGAWPWQWNVLLNPLGFIIYFICALAETNRAPFDLPEAESELTAGFHTEYSGMGFGLFFLAEYANMIVVCAAARWPLFTCRLPMAA